MDFNGTILTWKIMENHGKSWNHHFNGFIDYLDLTMDNHGFNHQFNHQQTMGLTMDFIDGILRHFHEFLHR